MGVRAFIIPCTRPFTYYRVCRPMDVRRSATRRSLARFRRKWPRETRTRLVPIVTVVQVGAREIARDTEAVVVAVGTRLVGCPVS